MKKVISFALVLSMIMSLFCTFAIASSAAEKKALEGEKSAEHIEDDKYGITVKVPGGDGEIQHDEVILMVDGSYSMDNEWPAMKEAINLIGETVLNGNGNTQLTLMAFGMGDNIVLEHVKDADALAASLGALPGNLLYGRSSTNCEAGFTGVAEYIANHDSSLRDAYVIFISDGNLNTDETPRAFDANWRTWTKFGDVFVAQSAFEETLAYGEKLPAAFKMFEARFAGATNEEIITRAFAGEVSDAEFIAFAEQVWTDVYAYSGLTRGVQYPISDAERAFVKYDKENGTYIQDLFYYATYKSAYVTYGDRWTRTPAAADKLAAMAQVKAMYVVDYDGYTSWMDTGIKSEKSEFIHSEGIAGLCAALSGVVETLSRTPFNDVVVVDYMSKWVNLVPETIKVTDAEGKVVAAFDAENSQKDANGKYTSYAFKWIGEPLCKNKAPIVLDLIPESEYVAGGAEVIGNMSGDIYRITWNLKDGPLYRHDAYELHYDVTVDYDEKGFKYDVDLPANGNTDIKYFDEDGKENEVKIKVPNIIVRRLVSEEGKIVGMKRLNGSNPGYYRFNFLLTDTATGKTVVATNDSTGRFSFDIGSKEPGIYFYTLEEINDGDPDVIYDDDKYNVTVIIDETGTYVYCTEDIVFNNRTVKPAKVTIKGSKYLDGKLADGFTFLLKDKYGNTVDVAESENGKFRFTLSLDAGGTYTYYVSEIQGDDDNIVYDDSVFEVKVTVTKAKNNYKASVSLIGATKIAFYNNTIPEETTEAPEETTEAPEETTEAPEETTEVPEETTEAPEETTEAPEETTEIPEETTEAPEETTEIPEETTEVPEETTEAPEETTEVPEETTEAPEETTEVPEVTTEPEEEITEEPTPLDPTPETTEPEEEITEPEIPLNPKTGDSSILLVIAAIASIALAVLYFKRRQVIED